nr:hypothetical protein [Bacteroidota bacterium]
MPPITGVQYSTTNSNPGAVTYTAPYYTIADNSANCLPEGTTTLDMPYLTNGSLSREIKVTFEPDDCTAEFCPLPNADRSITFGNNT